MTHPSKIVRHEFMGSWVLFWLLSISIIGLPAALIYFVNSVVRIEHELEDAEGFLSQFRAGRSWKG